MNTIWKYNLYDYIQAEGGINTRIEIVMPQGAFPLAVQDQKGQPCLWALVDPATEYTVTRVFYIVGTGMDVPDEAERYVGTWQSGPFVFHLFAEDVA